LSPASHLAEKARLHGFDVIIVPFFTLHWTGAKLIAAIIGFIDNFALRKALVFSEKEKRNNCAK